MMVSHVRCPRLLVLGYGNTLRSDDGVGQRVAEAVAELRLLNVEVLSTPQLTPELAEPVSRARQVVFVDAAIDAPREVQLRKLEPADSAQVMAHAADPRTILALARDLFGEVPKAWWLTIPIEQTGIGEELSTLARHGCATAIQNIKNLADWNSDPAGRPAAVSLRRDCCRGQRKDARLRKRATPQIRRTS